MRMRYYLGIDNGGTNTKAAVFDETGKQVAAASESTRMVYLRPGFVERDMEEMWQANCAVIKSAVAKAGIRPEDIRSIAICGHGKGLYLWGKNGQPVRRGIASTDNRAISYQERWKRDGTELAAFELTCQHIMACQPIPLLAWLRDNEPECLNEVKYIFACKDYIRFRMTGEAFAERTDFSGSGLLNLHTGNYDERILGLFGMEQLAGALPPLMDAVDICGYVTAEAAALTGLCEGTPVAGGMFDIDACALSAAVVDDKHVCMVAGTWSINEFALTKPVVDGRVLMNSLFCMPGRYLIEESSATSAGNLAWYLRNFADGEDIYGEANHLAESVDAQELSPVFLPFIMASNVNPNAKGAFVGINANHTKGHMVRSIYEGIAFCHRWHYEKLLDLMDKPPVSIRLVGGVANSAVWTQIFADVMKCPVETSSVEETGAHGAAIAAAVAVGDMPDITSALKSMVELSEPVLPNERNLEVYDKKYELYKSIIDRLDPIWDGMQLLI